MDGDSEALMGLQALAMVFGDEASDTDGECAAGGGWVLRMDGVFRRAHGPRMAH